MPDDHAGDGEAPSIMALREILDRNRAGEPQRVTSVRAAVAAGRITATADAWGALR